VDCVPNPQHAAAAFPDDDATISRAQMATAYSVTSQWPGYAPTALLDLVMCGVEISAPEVIYHPRTRHASRRAG
jgi:hypothetical protein